MDAFCINLFHEYYEQMLMIFCGAMELFILVIEIKNKVRVDFDNLIM